MKHLVSASAARIAACADVFATIISRLRKPQQLSSACRNVGTLHIFQNRSFFDSTAFFRAALERDLGHGNQQVPGRWRAS